MRMGACSISKTRRCVASTSGQIENGKAKHFQVTLRVGITMEGPH
jgi:flavin-binding protein dodecin